MENLINSLGGFYSWQFAVVTFGTLLFGGLLTARKWYYLPVLLFGVMLLYKMVEHDAMKLGSVIGSVSWL